MDEDLAGAIVEIVLPLLSSEQERRALVFACCPALADAIDFDGPAEAFAWELVRRLTSYGEASPGVPALIALLDVARERVGVDRRAEIDKLALRVWEINARGGYMADVRSSRPDIRTGDTSDEALAERRGYQEATIANVLARMDGIDTQLRHMDGKLDSAIRSRYDHARRIDTLEQNHTTIEKQLSTVWSVLFGNGGSGRVGLYAQFRWLRAVFIGAAIVLCITTPLIVSILLSILSRLPGG